MHILEMQAAYGRLRGDSLRLEPGLNLIYAPNESGKSTWCSFIRTMLYGLPTRQSGPLADKNRFAPWTGEAMQGRMDLETDGRRWTVLRDTRRASAPMQNFACTYTGTAQPVPEVNGQNLGETLLGVPREVFQRSAFIGQSGLAVSQDPELERRIAALLSTGQEDVSYSESYDRLKKQLNRRRHNKTGLIPQLEQEQARLDDALRRQAELSAQLENAREQQCTAQTRVEELEQRRAQWEALEKQEALRQWREAQEDLARRSQQLTALQQLDGNLPDRDTLARMQAQLELLEQAGGTLTQARRIAQQRQTEAREAQEAWSAHPLYPNNENQLRQQAEAMTAPAGPGKALPIAAGVLLCAADTFRAAAADQLEIWAERAGCEIVRQYEGADPGAVLFDALQAAKARNVDVVLCDTAGRLHNKANLMAELAKLSKIIDRECPDCDRETLLVLDATTGQNGLIQARTFKETAGLTGIVLTKLDGTAKGGIVIAIARELGVPVKFAGVGEGIDDLKPFDAHSYVEAII